MLKKIIAAFAPMVTLYGANFVLSVLGIYEKIPYIDNPMHILGGITTAWTGLLLYTTIKQYRPQIIIVPRLLFFVAVIGFTAFISILWEHYEYLHDVFLYSRMQSSIGDTMKDLFLDLLGAIVFCIVLSHRLRKKKLKPGEY